MNETPIVCLAKSPALVNRFALSKVVAPPIGLAYLAGTLKAHDIKTQIIDAVGESPDQMTELEFADAYSIGLTMDEIVERMDPRIDIVGLSCMFSSSWPYDARLARLIRARFPEAKIVLGGEHATACADYVLKNHPEVDFCVKGEGENTLLHLVQTIRAGGDYDQVPGLVYRGADGEPRHTVAQNRILKLDDIPLPDWDSFPIENYMSRGLGHGVLNKRNMPLLATRGCPYQCTFCSSPQMWTTRYKTRDPKLVVDEMEHYVNKYNAENFDLYDLTAIIQKKWIVAFAHELMARKLDVTYQLPSGTRSEAIDGEVARLLIQSGCRQMNYAPESGSPETLKRIKKKVKLENLEASLEAVCAEGMRVMCNTILFPDDTHKDVLKTFAFMLRCSYKGLHDISFVPYVPYPGAELYNELVERGELPQMSEEYFLSLLTHSDISKANSYNPRFSPKTVQAIRIAFLATFYASNSVFRPWRALQMIRNVTRNTPTTRGEDALRNILSRQSGIRGLGAGRKLLRWRPGRAAQASPA